MKDTLSVLRVLAGIAAFVLGLPTLVRAQTDEIQVYDASIADRGTINLALHNNFIANGAKTPSFPGGLIADRSFNGVAEWAYGVTSWFEAGLYLPLYSISKERGPTVNGGKIRLLFVAPGAEERRFFYGANFELSYNSRHWDPRRYTSEVRPILGWHLKPLDIIFNPIVDSDFVGGAKRLQFRPATRVAYNLNDKWAVSIEEYADMGPLRQFYAGHEQSHQVYGVVNHKGKTLEIEAGVGFGVTGASDRVTFKLMLERDLHTRTKHRAN